MMDVLGVIIALTAIAAGAGAAIRFVVDSYLNHDFPIGTLAVNLVASFLLGMVVSAADPIPTIVGIGALGALSTWAMAATEAAEMARSDRAVLGLTYIGLTVSSGVLLAWFGLQLGPAIF